MIKKFRKYLKEELNKEDYIATLSSDSLEHIVKDYFEGRDILFTIEEGTKIFINMNTLDYPKMVVLKELQKYLKDTFVLDSKIRDVGHKTKTFVLIVPIQILDKGVSLMEGIDYSSLDTEQKEYLDELNDSDTEIFDMRDFEHYANKIGVSLEELMTYLVDKNLLNATDMVNMMDMRESNELDSNISNTTNTKPVAVFQEKNPKTGEFIGNKIYYYETNSPKWWFVSVGKPISSEREILDDHTQGPGTWKRKTTIESLEEYHSHDNIYRVDNNTEVLEDLNESHLEFNIKPITDVRKGDLAYNLINHTPAIVLKPNHTDNIVHIIELYKEIDKNVKLIYDYLIQEGDFKQIEEICKYVHKDGMRINDKESAINSMKSVQADVKQFTDSEKNDFLYRYKDVLKDAVIDAEIFAPIKEVVYNDVTEDDSVYVYDYTPSIKETNRMVESFEKFTYINENKDYLRQIAKDIKKKYKDFKFSIRVSYNKISISILEAPIELRLDTSEGNEPVNHYYVRDHYKENPEAKEVLADIADMALSGQKEKSYDGDYGSIPNYYVDLEVGKWDKPFKVVGK